MDTPQIAAALRAALVVTLKLGGPPLLGAMAVGLIVSLLQAVTQINEATLAFVPKVLVVCAVFALLGSFMTATLTDYARGVMDQLVSIGGR